MLDRFIESLISVNTSIDVVSICASLVAGFVVGLFVFIAYKLTTNEFEFDPGFGLVLVVISMIVSALICAIGTNIARAFSVAGILSLIRYRSAVVKPKDLAFIFFSMGVGFISGIGFYIPALIMTVIVSLVIVIYSLIGMGRKKSPKKTLKIAVPENIDYDGLFDETLKKYTTSYSLRGIRIISGGTVTELTYDIRVKNMADAKAFLDDLRVLNANFKIQLTEFVAE
ncbi:MAG: DUF4956 domain-containing protein [Ruminococcaceae bacterium]|nr:DUF4956 domain-containing protein [Oscillospiraceae bacterium]